MTSSLLSIASATDSFERKKSPRHAPLLDVCLAQTRSDGAYMYRLNTENGLLELVTWQGLPIGIGRFRAQVSKRAAAWYFGLTISTVLSPGAWLDWRFENFPEFLCNRFEAVASIPLLDAGQLIGIGNFCRTGPHEYSRQQVRLLEMLSVPLAAYSSGRPWESRHRGGPYGH
jgi:GAF domain-containing protein